MAIQVNKRTIQVAGLALLIASAGPFVMSAFWPAISAYTFLVIPVMLVVLFAVDLFLWWYLRLPVPLQGGRTLSLADSPREYRRQRVLHTALALTGFAIAAVLVVLWFQGS